MILLHFRGSLLRIQVAEHASLFCQRTGCHALGVDLLVRELSPAKKTIPLGKVGVPVDHVLDLLSLPMVLLPSEKEGHDRALARLIESLSLDGGQEKVHRLARFAEHSLDVDVGGFV